MRFLGPEERKERAQAFPMGCRVRSIRLVYDGNPNHHNDNETVPPGTEGTVVGGPDGTGSIPTDWDNGAKIQFLIEDQVERIDTKEDQ